MKTMKEWVRRRERSHKPWNADELWNRIKTNWPSLSEEEQERIYQDAVAINSSSKEITMFNVYLNGTHFGTLPYARAVRWFNFLVRNGYTAHMAPV
jgi:hypothetical protein